jgi:hypothetical protein
VVDSTPTEFVTVGSRPKVSAEFARNAIKSRRQITGSYLDDRAVRHESVLYSGKGTENGKRIVTTIPLFSSDSEILAVMEFEGVMLPTPGGFDLVESFA